MPLHSERREPVAIVALWGQGRPASKRNSPYRLPLLRIHSCDLSRTGARGYPPRVAM